MFIFEVASEKTRGLKFFNEYLNLHKQEKRMFFIVSCKVENIMGSILDFDLLHEMQTIFYFINNVYIFISRMCIFFALFILTQNMAINLLPRSIFWKKMQNITFCKPTYRFMCLPISQIYFTQLPSCRWVAYWCQTRPTFYRNEPYWKE